MQLTAREAAKYAGCRLPFSVMSLHCKCLALPELPQLPSELRAVLSLAS